MGQHCCYARCCVRHAFVQSSGIDLDPKLAVLLRLCHDNSYAGRMPSHHAALVYLCILVWYLYLFDNRFILGSNYTCVTMRKGALTYVGGLLCKQAA